MKFRPLHDRVVVKRVECHVGNGYIGHATSFIGHGHVLAIDFECQHAATNGFHAVRTAINLHHAHYCFGHDFAGLNMAGQNLN